MGEKSRKFHILLTFLFLIALPVGVGGETQKKTHEILVLKDTFRFSPEVIHISVGDSVKWVNHDTRAHLFSSVPGTGPTGELEFLCEEMNPEQSCSHTFGSSGEYPYFCFIHKQMLGLVVVGN